MTHRFTLLAALLAGILLPRLAGSTPQRCAASSRAVDGQSVIDLVRWFGDARKDQFTTADPGWHGCVGDRIAGHGGYRLERIEGAVFAADAPQPPGTVPLHTWYSPSRQEHFTTTDPRWRGRPGAPMQSGYRYVRLEGFVYDPERAQPPGTRSVHSWWNGRRQDNFMTSGPMWSGRQTTRQGYRRFRLEGYLIAPDGAANADTSSASTPRPLPEALGCFVDRADRDLPVVVPGDRHTPASCITACRGLGHAFAAVQFGGHCFCGDAHGEYGQAALDDCRMPCRAAADEACGGSWRNLVLPTGVTATPRTPGSALDVRIVTYNVKLMPGIIGNRRSPNGNWRADRIAEELDAGRFDIIALNEAFDDSERKRLRRALERRWQARGWTMHRVSPPNRVAVQDAGVLIMSRYPIEDKGAHTYDARRGKDRFARKAALFARIALPGGQRLDLFATHLQAVSGKKHKKKIRTNKKQIVELARMIERRARADVPLVILGDMNVYGNPEHIADANSHYSYMMSTLRGARADLLDVWPRLHPGARGETNSPNRTKDNLRRLDYMLLSAGQSGATATPTAIEVLDFLDEDPRALPSVDGVPERLRHPDGRTVPGALSDHSAVSVTLRISP